MPEFNCCPDHPDAKHTLVLHHIRHPDLFDFPEFWWVWSCQHMERPYANSPIKVRCGYRSPVQRQAADYDFPGKEHAHLTPGGAVDA